jgi:putative oxygen-independent coproporphyrinogen III oxidase
MLLYIHWPFCISKCPYCDFNSHVRKGWDVSEWISAFDIEMKRMATKFPHKIETIFFGGGTPSLMDPSIVNSIIKNSKELFGWQSENIEITLEANPNSVESAKFELFAAAGVNRISIGIQSLRSDKLKFLGRKHSVDEARSAIRIAKSIFDNVSIDLIYGRPEDKLYEWKDELLDAISFNTDHMSLYMLTIEEGTPFYLAHKRGDWKIPENDAELYELTNNIMADNGFMAYEISNYSKSPDKRSFHNLGYWKYKSFCGIGPGAHSRIDGVSYTQYKVPEKWLKNVMNIENPGSLGGIEIFDILTEHQIKTERMLMGLRLPDGISLEYCNDIINKNNLIKLEIEGLVFIDKDSNNISITKKGKILTNSILDYLIKCDY